jgi:Flp pilus assembly pilin Flp
MQSIGTQQWVNSMIGMLEVGLNRATNLAFDAVGATAVHLGRIVGLVSTALVRTAREVSLLAGDYEDLATDLSRGSDRGGTGRNDVLVADFRRFASRRRDGLAGPPHLAGAQVIDLRRRLN